MSGDICNDSRISPRYLTILGGVVVALVSFWLYAGPVSNAHAAENFCLKANLAKFGQPGDRCTAPNGHWNYSVAVETFEQPGCETTENNGELIDAWTCALKNSSVASFHSWGTFSHGIIRNDNTKGAGIFSGGQAFCNFQNCEPT